MSLVRESITSLYEQIASRLREEIRLGYYDSSGKLPSETELGIRYAVSRVTVRLALSKLTEEGVVERKQGKGTYIAGKQIRHGLDTFRSFHEALKLQGLQPTMQFIDGKLLSLPKALHDVFVGAENCFVLQRLHLVDNEPVALGHSYLPAELEIVDWKAEEQRPAYAVLESITGLRVARANLGIRAQQANKVLAETLGVKRGAALLVLERSSYFSTGACCDRSTFYIRPERYTFVLSGIFGKDA
ncbi:GntR family transcriptional regulator [Methylomonas sp. AM2-LC]|uniref:GntR family transcriptional regulator n=1 Tax=Methylomonas sp. AM2-LC TaxID=3153301 RepID=UPI003266F02F